MLARSRTDLSSALHAAILAGLVGFPLVATVAVAGEQASKAAQGAERSPGARAAIIRGRVTDEAGAPLADVRVLVRVLLAIPAADMRNVPAGTDRKQLEARSDAKGDYTLELPGLTGRTRISIDAMKPGYRSLRGPLMSAGDEKRFEVGPGAEVEAPLMLKPALYFAGTVVDEQRRPIPAVKIAADAYSRGGSASVERTASNSVGSFELFNYPVKPFILRGEVRKGGVRFFHPDYIDREIEDVYALGPKRAPSPPDRPRDGLQSDGHGPRRRRQTGPQCDGQGHPQGRRPS